MENEELKQTAESGGSTLNDGLGKQYGDRNPIEQGIYYLRHVKAMTEEGLHSKAAIAEELAHRDIEIDRLKQQVKELKKLAFLIFNDETQTNSRRQFAKQLHDS